MSAAAALERFERRLLEEKDLAGLVRMVGPYRSMMGDPSSMVQLLDRLATAYLEARGGVSILTGDASTFPLELYRLHFGDAP